MPGLKHQSIVQILRDEPQLVTMFLGRSGFRLPSFALACIAEARGDRYRRYVHLIRIFTPRHARKELEQLMEDLFKDPFIDRFIEEGMQQGMQQGMQKGKQLGRAEGAARVLLTILAARGIAKVDQVRTRISECTDPDLLERWATRAATCSTIDEVFAS
jgi:hypothetical protein